MLLIAGGCCTIALPQGGVVRSIHKALTLGIVAVSVWVVGGAGPALGQDVPAPDAQRRAPGTEIRIGDSVLFWRAPVELPGLDAIRVQPGEGDSLRVTVARGRGTGHLKIVRHHGPWPRTLVLDLAGFRGLASFSVCDSVWCAESSLGSAPDAAVTLRAHSREEPAPIVRTTATVQDSGVVATMPLDWLVEARGAVTVRWAEQPTR